MLTEQIMKNIDDLRNEYDSSEKARRFNLDFNSYALLYRYKEGVKGMSINESLYISRRTLQRCKEIIIRAFGAASFEQALIEAGKTLFEDGK